VQRSDLAMLLKRFGKFGRVLWERSQGIDERSVNNERLRKSVGVERTLIEDIHDWSECEAIITGQLYPELERRLAKVKPDLLIARQGIKLKFNDFQQTTQEHVWPRLNKDDLIATAKKPGKNDGVEEGFGWWDYTSRCWIRSLSDSWYWDYKKPGSATAYRACVFHPLPVGEGWGEGFTSQEWLSAVQSAGSSSGPRFRYEPAHPGSEAR
jgi:hypothetical protein